MLSTLKSYLYGAAAALMAVLSFAVWYLASKADRAERRATEAQERANQEKAAREHIQQTTEKSREIEADNRRLTPEQRRERLRDEYAAPRDSD